VASTTPKVEIDFDSPVPYTNKSPPPSAEPLQTVRPNPVSGSLRLGTWRRCSVSTRTRCSGRSTRSGRGAVGVLPRARSDGHRCRSTEECRGQAGAGTGQAGAQVPVMAARNCCRSSSRSHEGHRRTPKGDHRPSRGTGSRYRSAYQGGTTAGNTGVAWHSLSLPSVALAGASTAVALVTNSPPLIRSPRLHQAEGGGDRPWAESFSSSSQDPRRRPKCALYVGEQRHEGTRPSPNGQFRVVPVRQGRLLRRRRTRTKAAL